jgi:hypothetical protein
LKSSNLIATDREKRNPGADTIEILSWWVAPISDAMARWVADRMVHEPALFVDKVGSIARHSTYN